MNARWIVAATLLLTPVGASAQSLCGAKTVTQTVTVAGAGASVEVFVTANQRPGQTPIIDYVTTKTFTADGSFSLDAAYDPVADALGAPKYVAITAYMPLPDAAQAQPERIVWRLGDGAWTGPRFTSKPDRRWGDPTRIEGYLNAIVRPQELSAAIENGDPIALRRVDAGEATLAEAVVRAAPGPTMTALYVKARKGALADLKRCGPPLMIPPVKERTIP